MTCVPGRTVALLLLAFASSSAAQQAPRPVDATRAVTLSLGEYNRLIDAARRPVPNLPAPPLPAVLGQADLQVRVERDSARGVFSLTGNVLRDGLTRVQLLSGVTVVDAGMAGQPLPLGHEGETYWAMLPGPGPFALTLDWGAGVTVGPGRASFVLPVPPSGTAHATIDVPGEQADVRLSTGLITSRNVRNGRTIVDAMLDPGSSTEVSWSMRDSAPVAAARELRAFADVLTLVTIGDSDVRMAAIADITVLTGELRTLEIRLPDGVDLSGIIGSTIESSAVEGSRVALTLRDPAQRQHQFLITFERSHDPGSFKVTSGLVTLPGVQRERGEVAFEGVGTLELTVAERDDLHRMDVRELSPALHALARLPVLSAFRYQGSPGAPPALSLSVERFGDAGVLAAVADRATATTIVTTEGRALTEISLQIRNRAQPFLKVVLPAGATMVSVEVAGEPAKPALGADGVRVPLLRVGFRPQGPYNVSFVYLHDGQPFARQGRAQMNLPRMDMPVSLVEWELFVPQRYVVRPVGGNALSRQAFRMEGTKRMDGIRTDVANAQEVTFALSGSLGESEIGSEFAGGTATIAGWVTDPQGVAMPGVAVQLTSPALGGSPRTGVTNESGAFRIVALPAGTYTAVFRREGFGTLTRSGLKLERGATRSFDTRMQIGSQETITVVAEAPVVDVQNARQQTVFDGAQEQSPPKAEPPKLPPPSQNVINLQRRAAGVLPVRVEVPRAGTSHQFVKPLAVDQEITLELQYKRR